MSAAPLDRFREYPEIETMTVKASDEEEERIPDQPGSQETTGTFTLEKELLK